MRKPVLSAVLLGWLLCACYIGIVQGNTLRTILDDAKSSEFVDKLLQWRRELHKMPELFFSEVNTSQYIRDQLDLLGIPYEYPFGKTGIRAGPIGSGDEAAPTIALRADMDALPITEEVDVPYKSTTPGRMHACGHDAHMAMLLGAASLLKAREAALPGRVVLLFQPAEESHGGARELIREGALRGVGAIHGLHVWPALASGVVGTRAGVAMAASDRFAFTVRGVGGHGALPHTARDPVVAASAVVMALQALVARETSPLDSAVVTVARFNTGPGASNVIPESVELSGTVRALSSETFERLHRRLEQAVVETAAGFGCRVDNVTWSAVPYPPTRNEEGLASLVREVAVGLLGSETWVQQVEPSMAAEDFSFYGEVVPQASFTFLGIGDSSKGTHVGLHSPHFKMDEDQMPLGAALHVAVATEWLSRQHPHHRQDQASAEAHTATAPTEDDGTKVQGDADPGEQEGAEEGGEEEGEAQGGGEEAAEAEDPRIEGLKKYARENGVKGMPSWLRKLLADDPEFGAAVAQADWEEGMAERLRKARESLEERRRERELKRAAEAAAAAAAEGAGEGAGGEQEEQSQPQDAPVSPPHEEL